jgi:hypothetical protein
MHGVWRSIDLVSLNDRDKNEERTLQAEPWLAGLAIGT